MSNLAINQKSAYFIRKTPASQASPTSPENTTKPASNVLNIPGTRTSIQNNQLLTPIGIPSIDSFIGGGLPVGSVCLIGQDKHNTYTDLIARCFIAEGIVHKHALYIADLNEDTTHLMQRIPSLNKLDTDKSPSQKKQEDDELRIAWRYGQNQTTNPTSEEKVSKAFQANYFVMNKFMSEQEVQVSNMKSFSLNCEEKNEFANFASGPNPLYVKLAKDITNHIDQINMNINKTKKYSNICRIVINSIGGLLWNDKSTFDDDAAVYLCQFLLCLRSLLRHSLAVVMITLPNELVQNPSLMDRFTHLSDYVFSMDDSVSTTSRLTKTEYDGLFRLSKLPHLNSLNSFQPSTLDLAFFLKRKRLVVEQLHLPPDLGENDDTQKGRTGSSVTASCGSSDSASGARSKLDF